METEGAGADDAEAVFVIEAVAEVRVAVAARTLVARPAAVVRPPTTVVVVAFGAVRLLEARSLRLS